MADNLTTFTCQMSWNLRTWTSWKPLGLSRPIMVLLYLYSVQRYDTTCVYQTTWCCNILEGIFLSFFYVLLTVHPDIMTVFFFTNLMHKFFILILLLRSCACFEHYCAHLQEDNCISTASGIVTVFRWLFSTQVTAGLVTCVLNSHLKTLMIPDAVLIQLSSWMLPVLL